MIGSLFFAAPWVLVALAALPALYWILRVVPPAPKRLQFPALRLLLGLQSKEETSATTPWWLLALRLAIAGAFILALSGPSLNPPPPVPGSGPVVLVVETGWGAAQNWQSIRDRGNAVLDYALREGRPVLLISTTASEADAPDIVAAPDARRRFAALTPKAYEDEPGMVPALVRSAMGDQDGGLVWLSDGMADDERTTALRILREEGGAVLHSPEPGSLPLLLKPAASSPAGISATLMQSTDVARSVSVTARASDGRVLGTADTQFAAGSTTTEALIRLPREVANAVTRLDIVGQQHAAAVALLDDRWQRRAVGLVTGAGYDASQPLLDERHYLTQALLPFADVTTGAMADLFGAALSMVVLPDTGALAPEEQAAAVSFMEEGGILLRFAGPALAADATEAELVPVDLRSGGRLIGGALSWDEPARLAPFPETGPFASLALQGDVTVRRQVLANPSLNLIDQTWAALEDGTPLVTAEKRGEGWLVLVHTTAIPEWTDLPISGLFVEMLSRLVDLGRGVDPVENNAVLPALDLMDGFGQLGAPLGLATALTGGETDPVASAETPPGWYGTQTQRRAINLGSSIDSLPEPMGSVPTGVSKEGYGSQASLEFAGPLLVFALLLLIADMIVSLVLRGLISPSLLTPARSTSTSVAMVGLAAVVLMSKPAQAQDLSDPEAFAFAASETFRLAYIETGDETVDRKTYEGLYGLSRQLSRRTAVEPAPPLSVVPGEDEMAFFPLVYWQITPTLPPLSGQAVVALNRYLTNGGTIVFDTADEAFGGGAARDRLSQIAERIDIPPLEPIGPEHVMTKTFYLTQEFPGRYDGGTVWVERRAGDGDEVSSVIAGSHDWVAAWATDNLGRPLYPIPQGGLRQREWSYRFGVNLVMYALTGNYKADQVHLPAIIERLSQ